MALLWCHGFDNADNGNDVYKAKIFSYHTGNSYWRSGSQSRTVNGRSMQPEGWTASHVGLYIPDTTVVIAGFAILPTVNPSASEEAFIYFRDNVDGNDQLRVKVYKLTTSTFGLKFYSGNDTLLGTSTYAFTKDNWYYIEIKVNSNSSTGSVKLRINGATDTTLTNVDTDYAATTDINDIRFYGNTVAVCWDDMYLVSGTIANDDDFLGDVSVKTYTPTSDGDYEQFNLSGGSNSYDLINDTWGQTLNYIEGDAVDERSSFHIGTVDDRTVKGIAIYVSARNPDAGSRGMKTFVRSGTSDYDDSTTHALNNVINTYTDILELNPATSSAWTKTSLEAVEFGVKVQS